MANANSSSDERRVLVAPPTQADGLAMSRLFGANRIQSAICTGVEHLCSALQSGAGTLILSEEALLQQPEAMVACVAGQSVWSDLPIIVLSQSGRESIVLAGIIHRMGNVSVVERPVRTSTLVSLVRSCLRARDRQYQVREYLTHQEQAQAEREALLDSERAARTEAERASRTKDEFLATLSHELRTPLHSILGWTQVLRRSKTLSQDVTNAVDVIERNARAQAQIIADLLDMSSIISGKVRLDVQGVDLLSVINATVETVKPTAQTKGVRLQVVLDSLAGPVRGDPNRLQQIFWNLLTNAVKFTRKEGRVAITLARVNSHLEIEVTDDGEGIDPEFLPHVFDRFRQADGSSARRHGGLGLGLSIVKQLVELHGGSITAKSPGRDMGSTFRVILPLMATSDEAIDQRTAQQHPADSGDLPDTSAIRTIDLKGLKVLVVDDEPDARFLIQRLLRDCNANVVTAASADEALQLLNRDPLDLMISDIGMPVKDGYHLIRTVRSLNRQSAVIPAIALTAYARIEERVKAINAGFQLHLSKPVEPIELIAMVESLARRPVARDQ